jgi:uncharacterized membrane protein
MKTNKLYLVLGLTLLIVTVLSACGTQATQTIPDTAPAPSNAIASPANSAPVSFAKNVLPIFESRCVKCHGGEQTRKNLNLKTYASVMTGSSNGVVITPSDAANSLLAKQIISGKMPKNGSKLTPAEIQLIVDWINAGAQNN